MRDNRVLKTEVAQYDVGEWDGNDTSGIIPLGDKLLVLTDRASEKVGTKGLIYAPDKTKEVASVASETGVIVAMGDEAFYWNSDRTRPAGGKKPKIGDRIIFERYAGREQRGLDGNTYRLMSDSAVGGFFHGGDNEQG